MTGKWSQSLAVKDDATTANSTLGRHRRMGQTPALLAFTFVKFRTIEATRHLSRSQGQRKHYRESCTISVIRDQDTSHEPHRGFKDPAELMRLSWEATLPNTESESPDFSVPGAGWRVCGGHRGVDRLCPHSARKLTFQWGTR